MDEESVTEYFLPKITPDGIAGLFLAQYIPDSDRAMQKKLGTLLQSMLAEGMRQANLKAIKLLEESPTISAAVAALEADMIEVERANDGKRVIDVDCG